LFAQQKLWTIALPSMVLYSSTKCQRPI
jgi:hypothetical protein